MIIFHTENTFYRLLTFESMSDDDDFEFDDDDDGDEDWGDDYDEDG